MRALPAKDQFAAFAVKLGTPSEQFFNHAGAFGDECAHGFDVTQPIAGQERVLFVEGDAVVVTQCRGNASLSVFTGGFMQGILCQNQPLAD